jgi:protein-S-isoprenylcysteine O-methyltransferase Ste14
MAKDSPGVIAPPPLIFLSGLLIGWLLGWAYPLRFSLGALAIPVGGLLALTGATLIALPWLQMRKAKTNIEPWKPTTAIVSDGIYGVTRNPVYLGVSSIYLGICAAFGLVWPLVMLPLVLIVIQKGVIEREESYLEAKFGTDYLDYKSNVRRWL